MYGKSSRLLYMLGVTADGTTHNRTNQYTTFSSTFYLSTVFLSRSSLFFVFESCESRGSRGERIDLGQPIAAAIPDGVPPGCAGFRVCKSARRLSCVPRCRSGLLQRELRCITPGVEGTRDVFVCQQYASRLLQLHIYLPCPFL